MPLRQVEREKKRRYDTSPFVTVRYPDGAWEVTGWEKVPRQRGEMLAPEQRKIDPSPRPSWTRAGTSS